MNVVPDCLLTNATEWREVRRAKLGVRFDAQASPEANGANEDILVRVFDDVGRFWEVTLPHDLENKTVICNAILGKAPQARAYWRFASGTAATAKAEATAEDAIGDTNCFRVLQNGTTWITPEPSVKLKRIEAETGMCAVMYKFLAEIQQKINEKEAIAAVAQDKQQRAEEEAQTLKDLRAQRDKQHQDDCERMIANAIEKLNHQKRLNKLEMH